MNRRRTARGGIPALKPYGFCCDEPHDDRVGLIGGPRTTMARGRRSSFASLHSLHESPALRLREEIISKRPDHFYDQPSARRSSSALKLGSGGGLSQLILPKGQHATESALELIAQAARRQRQIEYERRMDRLAEIGRLRAAAKEKVQHSNVVKGCEAPCWYTDLSLSQLQCLKNLEDAMFKDKEGKTISRTYDSLAKTGMVTDTVKLDPKILFKLINEYSDKPIEFLREIYKNIAGNYFEDEGKRLKFYAHERIIISAIVFMELPDIIIELHRRMPPLIQFEIPPKPQPPQTNFKVKKMVSPLLEKLNLPSDWKPYDTELFKWHQKLRALIKPFVVLPKKAIVKKDEKEETSDTNGEKLIASEIQGESSQEENTSDENSADHGDEQHAAKQETAQKSKNACNNQLTGKQQVESTSGAEKKSGDGKIRKKEQLASNLATGRQDPTPSYEPRTDWTEPPTPCPYKYRKLLDEKGPLKSDSDFFAELGKPAPSSTTDSICKRKFPPGRGGLSMRLQHYLLDVEADFFHLSQEANRITGAVGQIARQILDDSERPTCDACCACRQATLSRERDRQGEVQKPQTLVEGVAADETACRVSDNTRVIGATTMISPAVSVSTASEPPCIPSTDEFFKTQVIAGTCIEPDEDKPVQQVAGVVKALEHVSRRQLVPDRDPNEIKNVPPCGCRDNEQGQIEKTDQGDSGAAMTGCCAKRWRPNETRAYECTDFAGVRPKDQTVIDDDEGENGCGCGDEEFNYDCGEGFALDDLCSGDGEPIESLDDCGVTGVQSREPRKCNICKDCGREIPTKCSTLQRVKKKNAKKRSQRKPAYECSCDSLSEFLQLDITVTKCVKVDKSLCLEQKPINRRPSTSRQDSRSLTVKSASNVAQPPCDQRSVRTFKSEKSRAGSLCKSPSGETKKSAKSKLSVKTEDLKSRGALEESLEEDGPKDPDDTGGPYGYRTASEDALPVVKTIAYMVDNHPPATPAGMIPVREGGRPCRCRENRNNRRYMVYGLGGLTSLEEDETNEASKNGQPQEQNEEQLRLIEGVKWVTPDPSIRGSDEYIPEYELYDSPYKNLCNPKAVGKDAFKETKGRVEPQEDSIRWERATKDPYLSEYFTKNGTGGDCCSGTKSGTTGEPTKKLRVMKPVCECKNERRIVKRNEDRQKWQERQDYLKSFKKECFLHVSEISDRATIDDGAESFTDSDTVHCGPKDHMTVISEVTMQTPLATPVQSGTCRNLPFCPSLAEGSKGSLAKIEEKREPNEAMKEDTKSTKVKSKGCKASEETQISKKKESKESKVENAKNEVKASQPLKELTREDEKQVVEVTRITMKGPRSETFFDQMEEELMGLLEQEVKNMSDFYSLKLPDFHKMPQFKFWISYRVRGLKLRQKYKVDMKHEAMKVWEKFDSKYKQVAFAEPFVLPKGLRRRKLDFNRALYAKRKIARLQMNYFLNLRNEMVDIGRMMWRTMEYGHFPDLSFKQAYFTYMPSRDKDAYVVNSYHS